MRASLLPFASVVALAAGLAATPANGSQATPTAARLSPKVLGIVATGFNPEVEPDTVGLDRYTVQFHNIGETAVRITIGRLVSVLVPANGWQFRDVVFTRPQNYQVVVKGPGTSSIATISAQ